MGVRSEIKGNWVHVLKDGHWTACSGYVVTAESRCAVCEQLLPVGSVVTLTQVGRKRGSRHAGWKLGLVCSKCRPLHPAPAMTPWQTELIPNPPVKGCPCCREALRIRAREWPNYPEGELLETCPTCHGRGAVPAGVVA